MHRSLAVNPAVWQDTCRLFYIQLQPPSVVQRAPCGAVAVPADLPEDHVGEVDAKADRVGLFQLGNELEAMLGGPHRVVVVEAGQFGVVHLDR